MVFAIITHVPHGYQEGQFFAYSPYVREMNIWTKFVDKVILVAPMTKKSATEIDLNYEHKSIDFIAVPEMDLLSIKSILKSMLNTPRIAFSIYKSMKKADHIHLRCPGNIGLIGCLVQLFFPGKTKSAKYAGNWDPKATQPWSYKLQRWILSNAFLTKNMQVLVYGSWPKSSSNIKSFFTASYKELDKTATVSRNFDTEISFVFAGTFLPSKRPLYAVQLVEALHKEGFNVRIALYGNGKEYQNLLDYIEKNNLEKYVFLKGNQTQQTVREAYQQSHFVILPSQSEGWPKVIAEGMFWGCFPIASDVSCLGDMLDDGDRGLLLQMNLDQDVAQLISILNDQQQYHLKVQKSILWSRKYTLDLFENEIKALLIHEDSSNH